MLEVRTGSVRVKFLVTTEITVHDVWWFLVFQVPSQGK
mgnify:CR=1 FL=1